MEHVKVIVTDKSLKWPFEYGREYHAEKRILNGEVSGYFLHIAGNELFVWADMCKEVDEIGADFSRTCEGCEAVEVEHWNGEDAFRCTAEGRCKGYLVGRKRFLPYVPAWCPKINNNEEDLRK